MVHLTATDLHRGGCQDAELLVLGYDPMDVTLFESLVLVTPMTASTSFLSWKLLVRYPVEDQCTVIAPAA